jgi:hypothetical protein
MRRTASSDGQYEVQGMKKGVVIALCVAVLAAGASAIGWWVLSDRTADDGAASATAIKAPDAGALAARDERRRQHAEEHRHLWREASYIEVRQSAEGGNLVAQRRLSELYEDCNAFNGALRSSLGMLQDLAKTDRASQPTINAFLRDYYRLCTQAAADLRKNPGLALFWLHKSAKAGDVTSEIRYFGRTVPLLSEAQFKYFIDKARVSSDPDAIFELSLVVQKLKGEWSDPTQAPVFSGQSAEFAWAMAACRAGYDCARGSRLMNLLCITNFACGDADYERYLVNSSKYSAKRAEVEQLIAIIDRNLFAPKAQ